VNLPLFRFISNSEKSCLSRLKSATVKNLLHICKDYKRGERDERERLLEEVEDSLERGHQSGSDVDNKLSVEGRNGGSWRILFLFFSLMPQKPPVLLLHLLLLLPPWPLNMCNFLGLSGTSIMSFFRQMYLNKERKKVY